MDEWLYENGWMLFVGMGAMAALIGIFNGFKYLRCRKFSTTTGVVESTRTKAQWMDGGTMNGGGSGDVAYIPSVVYRYECGAESFRSDKVYSLGFRGYDKAGAEKVRQQFQPGNPVIVHYDPRKPSSSFLINGTRMVIFVFFFGGVLFCALGLFVCPHPSPLPHRKHVHRVFP